MRSNYKRLVQIFLQFFVFFEINTKVLNIYFKLVKVGTRDKGKHPKFQNEKARNHCALSVSLSAHCKKGVKTEKRLTTHFSPSSVVGVGVPSHLLLLHHTSFSLCETLVGFSFFFFPPSFRVSCSCCYLVLFFFDLFRCYCIDDN